MLHVVDRVTVRFCRRGESLQVGCRPCSRHRGYVLRHLQVVRDTLKFSKKESNAEFMIDYLST